MNKILIIEDEGILSYHLKIMLEKMGNQVVGAADNATDALEIVQSAMPDIVFMDMIIKGKVSGLELAKSICSEAGCKIIFMTGNPVSNKLLRDIENYPLLRKPFDKSQVKDAIEQVLSQ